MDRYGTTKRVAAWGIGGNLFLLVVKLIIGFASGSQAMIADGFNSAGDVFTSIMTYLGNRISSLPGDQDHPYGHGKAEYIFSMIISFSLLLVTYQIFKNSLEFVINKQSFMFSWQLAAVAFITIALKAILWGYTRRAGEKWDNLLIIANAEDHRNDILVTSATLIGIILGSRGIYWVDGVVGIGISLWIGFTGIRIFISAYNVLMDTNIDEKYTDRLIRDIEAIHGVDHVDSINAKPIGVSFIIIVKVSVSGTMTVEEGHAIAAQIKTKIKGNKNVGDVVVHVNPV
ncbi:MAG TPA: cation diffusion facilitator family transporter [Clostridia bacterium]|nr:cation diffusion facilitator family transporter [Clostridia bacterium]